MLERPTERVHGTAPAGSRGSRNAAAAAFVFVLLSIGLVASFAHDLRPKPIYARYHSNPSGPGCFVTRELPIRIVVPIEGPKPRVIVLPLRNPGHAPLHVRVESTTDGSVLADTSLTSDRKARLSLAPPAASPDAIVIVLSSDSADSTLAPELRWALDPARHDVVIERGPRGALSERGPLLLLQYEWPTRRLLWSWVAIPVLFVLARRHARLVPWYLAGLAAACMLTSVLLWQQNYTAHDGHFDADRYALNAANLARGLVDPDARSELGAWYRAYPHAHTSLGPALLVPAVLAGVPPVLAYLTLIALCGAASLVVFWRLLTRRLDLPRGSALLGVTLFGCHLLMLRSFARPVTDGLGLVLVLVGLDLLLARLQREGPRNSVWLALVSFALTLARPQGIAIAVLFAAGAFACDVVRGGRAALAATIRPWIVANAAMGIVLLALYIGFGWMHNVALMIEKAKAFRGASTPELFLATLVGVVQLHPLAWMGLRRIRRDARIVLLVTWLVSYVGILVVTRAPYWMRHFLPALPVVVALTALAWSTCQAARPRWMAALVIGLAVVNVAFTIYQVHLDAWVPSALRPFISSS